MQKLDMIRDINGFVTYGLPFADEKYGGSLAANTEQTLTVPISPFADYPNILAVFSFAPGASIWVSLNQTATVPSGNISSINVELNPAARSVIGGDILHFNTSDTLVEYGVIFYAIA